MMNKIIINIFLIISLISSSYALQVQETTGQVTQPVQNVSVIGGITINWSVIVPMIIIGLIIVIFISIIFFIIAKIIKKIRNNNKKKENLEYNKYSLDLKNANMNKNSRFKYKSALWLWLLYHKAKIYARTSEGRRFIGNYEGELVKKEGYFIIAIELKHSFFKREIDLVIFPYNLKKHLVFFNDDGTIDLECEGIDEVLASEYFSIPVFKNVSDKNKNQIFSDFSDDIRINYFENYSYRKVLKQNINDFADNVKEATEMNSNVTYQRKTGNDLRQ